MAPILITPDQEETWAMKRLTLSLSTLVLFVVVFFIYSQTGSTILPSAEASVVVTLEPDPLPPITLAVDRTDDAAGAMACTAAANDCSLRGAVRAANANSGASEMIITLAAGATYNLTLTNATQENSATTGDLDVLATKHAVTIKGAGSSGPNASTVSAAGLNGGTSRDRVFHITAGGNTVTFEDLVIADGRAVDDGTNGTSTVIGSQTTMGTGAGILTSGGGLVLTGIMVRNCSAIGRGDHVINDHTTLDAHGGGLAVLSANAQVKIAGTRFTGNTAIGGDGGNFNNGAGSNASGGSIYFAGSTLSIDRSHIDKSDATGGNGGNQDQNGQTNGGFGGMAQGGGIWIGSGTVTISDSAFDNVAAAGGRSGTGGNGANPGGDASGGGLYSMGSVTVNTSTFNLMTATGGNGGNAFGKDCFGAHNAGDGGAARGAAAFADGGVMVINTSTFANSTATGGNGGNGGQTNGGLNCGMHGAGGLAYGGAVTNNNAATLSFSHTTISLNRAQAGNSGVNQGGANKPIRPAAEGTGGGVRVGPAGVTFGNTIIAGNTAANGAGNISGAPTPGPNVDGAVTSTGHNLLGIATDATGFSGSGDKTGANPQLGGLAGNGGPTETMALLTGSQAIDSGTADGATNDQRGLARTFDDPAVANAVTSDGTDIGAFEAQSACRLCCSMNIVVSNDPGRKGAIVKYDDPSARGCGRVVCDHASGSFFPLGDTVVTCKAPGGSSCSFKVTVGGGVVRNPQ